MQFREPSCGRLVDEVEHLFGRTITNRGQKPELRLIADDAKHIEDRLATLPEARTAIGDQGTQGCGDRKLADIDGPVQSRRG